MPFITTKDNTNIYYNDLGKGDPVVLIHGWPLNSDMWEYQTGALLEKGFRVISYDRRGFGKSSQPLQGYNYDTFADDLHDLIEHLDLQKVRLVGFSMGGGEIARYFTRHGSKRIAKAALVASVVPYILKTDSNPNGAPEDVLDGMIQSVKEDRPKFLAGFAKGFYGVGLISSPVSEEQLQWHNFLAYQASPIATRECITAFEKTDFRGDLKNITVPTLVIHGTADKTVPIEATGDAAAKGISQASYKKYEGAPHGLFLTHRNQLNKDLTEFL